MTASVKVTTRRVADCDAVRRDDFRGAEFIRSVPPVEALLRYAVSSNPVARLLPGFRHGTGLGPFTVLPDGFASVAGTILVCQSYS